jgi:rubrerythrin
MNGTEFESAWFLHQFARNCTDPDLKRQIALVRNQEQQQQKRIAALKPLNENFLETTIGYEQLAIELTAILAQNEKDKSNRAALDLALLEDFDHLYRFSNLLKKDFGIGAETLVGKLTEIMPGRPTINEHRHPYDFIKRPLNAKTADPFSKLAANIITAAEQQTMNWYMNIAQIYHNDLGRKLFSEIAMVEEMHVSQYESLKDPACTWLENWLMHEYTECYLYYSCMQTETDKSVREIWQSHFEMEVAHLKLAAEALKKYEKKSVADVIPNPVFPKLLEFGPSNIDYVRHVIETQIWLTSDRENYIDVRKLPKSADYFKYNAAVNGDYRGTASNLIIRDAVKSFGGADYRFQKRPHPIPALDDRKKDNITVGRE